ncbi:ASCH domain-containing protein [Pasteurella canis]|uniref:ASCH domain-containing protein n=1 Tax=Pasteurella canis TaxID=753 RepID=UPI001CC3D732|nr:ASCH domain-containing protein [Pasteurella canis]UAY77836.1 ASCH domain-containing protein [Pasteurella canis]
MKVLMSIKPQYVEKIFSGEKKYELRRKIFQKDVKTIVVYASNPVMKIIGEIDIENIISDSPISIFDKYKEDLCINQEDYFRYFYNTNIAYAIKIKNIRKYSIPKNLDELGLKRAPQSYIYLL